MVTRPFDLSSLRHVTLWQMSLALRQSILHAERLATLLGSFGGGGDRTICRTWLTGRQEEVECFVLAVARDVKEKNVLESHAAKAIDAYLSVLHRDMAQLFGERLPVCCAASLSPLLAVGDSVATVEGYPPHARTMERYPLSEATTPVGALCQSSTQRRAAQQLPSVRRLGTRGQTRAATEVPLEDLLAGLATRADR